jgi:peptide/nickel transport system substrate-binding protein
VLDKANSVSGDHYTYTANPSYYDKSAQHWKKITVKVIASTTSALQALRSGQIDLMSGDAQTAETAKSAGLQVFHSPSYWNGMFLLDRGGSKTKALGDVRVRQALNFAVDRAAIAKAVYGEYASANDQPNTPGWDAYDQSLGTFYSYDVAKAKQLLAAAGYPNGFTMDVNYTSFDQTDPMMQAIASQLSKIGVTLKLKPNANISEYGTDLTSGKYAATSLTFGGQPQYQNVGENWLPTSVLNPFKVADPAFLKQFAEASAASPADIDAKMKALESTIVKDAYTLPVIQGDALIYARAGLKGVQLNPQGGRVNPLDWSN